MPVVTEWRDNRTNHPQGKSDACCKTIPTYTDELWCLLSGEEHITVKSDPCCQRSNIILRKWCMMPVVRGGTDTDELWCLLSEEEHITVKSDVCHQKRNMKLWNMMPVVRGVTYHCESWCVVREGTYHCENDAWCLLLEEEHITVKYDAWCLLLEEEHITVKYDVCHQRRNISLWNLMPVVKKGTDTGDFDACCQRMNKLLWNMRPVVVVRGETYYCEIWCLLSQTTDLITVK